jgi:RNA polymerase sigma-70 factor (ECF subfamily)
MMLMMMSVAGGAGPRPVPRRTPDTDWSSYIDRAARGEQQALAQLYDESSRLIYSVVARIVGDSADAEEVTLDVYAQIWRQAKDYTAGRGSPSTWMIMIARSRALDRVRSRQGRLQRETALEDVVDARSREEEPEEKAWLSQRRRRVRQAMADLAPEQREVIEMSFFLGFTHSELAEKLGQPLGTVKTRIRLGMIKLKQTLSSAEGLQ